MLLTLGFQEKRDVSVAHSTVELLPGHIKSSNFLQQSRPKPA
ncbi:hypothetical protein CHISP_1103 [Chitinispirillum alkaliphilum]|nr:hypothetical protein CHISP_1103 [Chitinispirillum alkaliphilum]